MRFGLRRLELRTTAWRPAGTGGVPAPLKTLTKR